jgi:multidrug efflux pump subunit AcrA (membrane-fusion protein)
MNTKKSVLLLIIILIVLVGIFVYYKRVNASTPLNSGTESSTAVSVKFVSSTITADGAVTAANQATLNFQIGGKLTYLPFKEGDKVYQGQTIASLDTYALEKQLQIAANTYQTIKNNTQQTLEEQQTGVLEGQQRTSLDAIDKNAYDSITEVAVIYDNVQRFVDNADLSQNSAQLNVDLANYSLQLASLTSPINGVILHEDVTTAGVNVTPVTSFVVADPSSMVFRANVPMEYIYYISDGSNVNIALDGLGNMINGTIVRIYPSKVILPSGEAVYQVDIQSDALKKYAKLEQTGTAIISTNSKNVALVPAWTVLAGKYIWVDDNGTPDLRQVTAGKIHGNEMEITAGLSSSDKIIINPKYIQSLKYHLL